MLFFSAGEIDYVRERDELNRMTEMLRTNPFVQSNSVLFWYEDFQIWLNRTKQGSIIIVIFFFLSEIQF